MFAQNSLKSSSRNRRRTYQEAEPDMDELQKRQAVYDNPDAKTSTAPDERDAGLKRYQGWNKPSSAPSNEDLGRAKGGLGDRGMSEAPRYGRVSRTINTTTTTPLFGNNRADEPELPDMADMDDLEPERPKGYGSQPLVRRPGQAPQHSVAMPKGARPPPRQVEANPQQPPTAAPEPAPAPAPEPVKAPAAKLKAAAKKSGMMSRFFGGFGKKKR